MMNRAPCRRLTPLAVVLALVAVPVLAQTAPDPETRFSTGVMHLKDGRVDLALEEFKKAAREDPKNPYFQKGLGLAYAAKRQWKDAIAAFRKALELNPFYVDVRNDLAYALIGSGDREAGKKELLAAFSDPTNPTPEISARNLGQVYLEEKNYPEAVNWFRTSITRNKAFGEAYVGLSDALVASGKVDEAIAQLELGVKEAPNDLGLALALGQDYFKAGRFADARARLEEVVKKDPVGPAGRAAAEQIQALPR